MLFNSYEFLLFFLPAVLSMFFLATRLGFHRCAIGSLVIGSLVYYGWWKPAYLVIIILSILGNYALAKAMVHAVGGALWRRSFLILGLSGNLGVLAYYKYTDFFLANFNEITGSHVPLQSILLPLAISFFTFQQVAYLVDLYRGKSSGGSFLDYCLFVSFFPQLIAGPIVHHSEMMPQFADPEKVKFRVNNLAVGLAIFSMGLFKKVILADQIAPFANDGFAAAEAGGSLAFFDAWAGALAYTCQIYFDFSGYSDMAIGLGRIFGIRLPFNFNSPYQAVSIIEFWRRWHMTLSRFLRDYLYFTLGGNRKGKARRYVNLIATMLLGGLWHGASWNFVLWGALHGLYLVVNHGFRAFRMAIGLNGHSAVGATFARIVTFLAVVVAWVPFRAVNMESAWRMVSAMFGAGSLVIPESFHSALAPFLGKTFLGMPVVYSSIDLLQTSFPLLVLLLLVAWFVPNSQAVMSSVHEPPEGEEVPAAPYSLFVFRPNRTWAFILSLIGVWAFLGVGQVSEFLYYQF